MTPLTFPYGLKFNTKAYIGPGGGNTTLGQEGFLLEDLISGKKILCHATQAGEPSFGCEKTSATISPLISGCLIPEIAIILTDKCGTQLDERPTKLCATPKIKLKQG